MTGQPLFDQVVASSRLNRLVAPFTVGRLLTRANVLPDKLTANDLKRALPEFERGLAIYLDPADFDQAITDIRAPAG